MILDYHRAEDSQAALKLLERGQPLTLPMGGGTILNAPHELDFDVVDLQAAQLDQVKTAGSKLIVGAAATLQSLLDAAEGQPALQTAIRHEASRNLRQVGTLAGTLVSSTGRSAFATAMMALDVRLQLQPGDLDMDLSQLLRVRAARAGLWYVPGQLITQLQIPLNVALEYHYVARTPADLPIVAVAAARWPAGRVRVVVSGWGKAPRLALDANDSGGLKEAVHSALSEAGDEWASATYRSEAGLELAMRAAAALELEG